LGRIGGDLGLLSGIGDANPAIAGILVSSNIAEHGGCGCYLRFMLAILRCTKYVAAELLGRGHGFL
jgi:hypothetical protein